MIFNYSNSFSLENDVKTAPSAGSDCKYHLSLNILTY